MTAARRWVRRRSLPGAWGALALGSLSFTPSLLPRSALVQGLVGGISAAIGYGLGVLAAMVWRAFADRDARRPAARSWWIFATTATSLSIVAVLFGRLWQHRLHRLMGTHAEPVWRLVLIPIVGVAVFLVLLAAVQGLQRLAAWLGRVLSRHVGARAANAVGALAVGVGGFLLVTGLLLDGFVAAADQAFSIRDTTTDEGIERPTTELRSGGPGSLVPWDSLGRQGRTFVAQGPFASDIAELRGGEAADPIRAYAGIATEEDVEDRAQRAVDDLVRAGGFERSHLLVATTTGTGWLEPGAMASFEYVTGGDAAIVGMQYSYLPSWLSYLVDQARARAAGRELFDAVYERWVALPTDDRPRLYVYGGSLGSYGAEAAFSGEFDLRNRVDGAMFVGSPAFNVLRDEFTAGRDPGSPEIEPVYRNGRTVRFATDIAREAPPTGQPWGGTRVLYLQHASDPIVWWDTDLLLRRPDWLREPSGHDVLAAMTWVPFVTFWQVTADMPFAGQVPDGHGHLYARETVDAWVALIDPPGWTDDDTARLRQRISP